ncbi:MAG: hypothetical protein JWQ87_3905 [Candidatus Sulfotelmatobacter sp.]|nr:hypothetical protein [Candidatus Sulfotelmatobacter sp.]
MSGARDFEVRTPTRHAPSNLNALVWSMLSYPDVHFPRTSWSKMPRETLGYTPIGNPRDDAKNNRAPKQRISNEVIRCLDSRAARVRAADSESPFHEVEIGRAVRVWCSLPEFSTYSSCAVAL